MQRPDALAVAQEVKRVGPPINPGKGRVGRGVSQFGRKEQWGSEAGSAGSRRVGLDTRDTRERVLY